MSKNPQTQRLISIVEPVCNAAGFDLVELRLVLEQGGWTLRVAVDLPVHEGLDITQVPEDRVDLGGIQVAWALTSARSYPYSVSPSEGARLQVAWLHEAEALGSDLSLDKLTVDARLYRRVFGERDVLALRAGGGTTWGEERFSRSYAVGGYPDANLFDIVRTNNAVLRGYPDNAFTGRRYAALNAEYRFPLFSPQRGWRSFPLFLRHFRGSVFFDAASVWSGDFEGEDVKTSAGASIGLDSAVGFALPVNAELTVAHGFEAQGDTKVYFRFGLAF